MDAAEKTVTKVVRHLVKVRQKRGISIYRIAEDTGLSASGIRHMEREEVNPTFYFLLRICEYLEVDLPVIMEAINAGKRPKL